MIALKPGVKAKGLQPEILLGVMILADLYREYDANFVLTAITDGKHMDKSKHYTGQAVDIRTKHLSPDIKQKIMKDAIYRLGADFDIILEGEGNLNEHIHLEFDPKV